MKTTSTHYFSLQFTYVALNSYNYSTSNNIIIHNIIHRLNILIIYYDILILLQVLSVLFFMCFVIEILFYYGIIQTVVIKLGWCLQKLLGTTAAESVNTCASVFLGMVSEFVKYEKL